MTNPEAVEALVELMGRALDVADRVIAVNLGMDAPKAWDDAFRGVAEARAALSSAPVAEKLDPATIEACAKVADKRAAMAANVSHEAARALLVAMPDAIRLLAASTPKDTGERG